MLVQRTLPFALLMAALVMAGCSKEDNPGGPSTTGDIAGKVLNEFDNSVVSGVTLKIQEKTNTTTSDGSGGYSLKGVEPGTYHLIASKDGFTTSFTDVTVTAGKSLALNIYISPPIPDGQGKVSGRVVDEDGKPMSGVTITTDPASKSTVTDADGVYRLVPIASDLYTVKAAKGGYLPGESTGDLRFTKDADSVNFVLRDSLPTKGLIARYALDGNAVDAVAGNNGQISGATGMADRFGVVGGALSFNGTDASVTIPSTTATNLGGPGSSFTISFWVKVAGQQGRYAGVLVKGVENTFGQLTSNGYHFVSDFVDQIPTTAGQLIVFGIDGPGIFYSEFGSEDGKHWFDGKWHNITITYDRAGGFYRRYSDGELIDFLGLDQPLSVVDLSSDEPLYLGRNQPGTLFYKGGIDDLRIYSRALSAEEVNRLFHERGYN